MSRKDLKPYHTDAREAFVKGMVAVNKWRTPGEPFTTDDDAWRFAFWWSLQEAFHFNIKEADVWQKLTDKPEFGHPFLRRMLAWVAARLVPRAGQWLAGVVLLRSAVLAVLAEHHPE